MRGHRKKEILCTVSAEVFYSSRYGTSPTNRKEQRSVPDGMGVCVYACVCACVCFVMVLECFNTTPRIFSNFIKPFIDSYMCVIDLF